MVSVLLMLLPFAVVLLFSATITILTRHSFGRCLPASMILCMVILYAGQMVLHTFNAGIVLIVAAAVAAIPLLWTKKENLSRLFLPGFFIWTGVFLFVFVWDFHRHFSLFDEFYFWGSMVSESLRLDQFYSVPESYLYVHKDYPPFITMIELLWCRLSGGYSESAVSMAMHTFLLSVAVLPAGEYLLDKERVKERSGEGYKEKLAGIITGLLSSVFMMLVLLLFGPWEPSVSISILVDGLVAILFAYAMWLVHKEFPLESGFGLLELALLTTAIIMIKQVGMGFLMVIALYAVLLIVIRKRTTEDRLRGCIKYGAVILIIPLLVQLTWKTFIKKFAVQGQFDLDQISVRTFVEVLTGEKQGIQHETLQKFGEALFQRDICSSWIPLTVVVTFVLLMVAVIMMNRFFNKAFDQREAIALATAFVCCTMGYVVLMAVLYTFCFNEDEMNVLASFMRYMASFMLGQFVLVLYVSLDLMKKGGRDGIGIKRMAIIAAVVILLAPMNLLYLMPQGLQQNHQAEYERDADYIADHTEVDANIFVIYDNMKCKPDWYGAYQNYLRYYAGQRYYSGDVDVFHLDLRNDEMVRSAEREIDDCDYVYVRNSNDVVEQFLADNLNCDNVKPYTLYSIQSCDGKLSLEQIR